MNNANVTADYDMFPADKADCVGGPEGRIWLTTTGTAPPMAYHREQQHRRATSQCDGMQTGDYGPQILNNWIHDYHYQNNAHTDGVQDYGGSHEVVKGNFMYNVPDCYVSYDGTNHADIEDNICVNDSSQNNGASPNVLVINEDNGSIVKHNTLVAFKDSYGNAGGILTIGSKSSSGSGTVLTDNVATGFNNCENGNCRPYTESHNLFIQGGPGGSGDVKATPDLPGGCLREPEQQPGSVLLGLMVQLPAHRELARPCRRRRRHATWAPTGPAPTPPAGRNTKTVPFLARPVPLGAGRASVFLGRQLDPDARSERYRPTTSSRSRSGEYSLAMNRAAAWPLDRHHPGSRVSCSITCSTALASPSTSPGSTGLANAGSKYSRPAKPWKPTE